MTLRILVIRRGCPHCREFLKVVPFINMKLKIGRRIEIFDNFEWEEFGHKKYPIIEKFEKEGFDAYPFCYIDGTIVEPAQKEILRVYFQKYFEKEMVI